VCIYTGVVVYHIKSNVVSRSILHKSKIVSMNISNESSDSVTPDYTGASDAMHETALHCDTLRNSISSGIFETCVRNGIVTLDREPELPHVISDDLCVVRNAIYGIASLNHIHPFCKVC
jgi:hypothetical protein